MTWDGTIYVAVRGGTLLNLTGVGMDVAAYLEKVLSSPASTADEVLLCADGLSQAMDECRAEAAAKGVPGSVSEYVIAPFRRVIADLRAVAPRYASQGAPA